MMELSFSLPLGLKPPFLCRFLRRIEHPLAESAYQSSVLDRLDFSGDYDFLTRWSFLNFCFAQAITLLDPPNPRIPARILRDSNFLRAFSFS